MNDDELMQLANEELRRGRALAAERAMLRMNELWHENERLIERSREIHREMAEVMASIPPGPSEGLV